MVIRGMIISDSHTLLRRASRQYFYVSPRVNKQSMACLVMGTSRDAAALMSSLDQFTQYTTFLLLRWKKEVDFSSLANIITGRNLYWSCLINIPLTHVNKLDLTRSLDNLQIGLPVR